MLDTLESERAPTSEVAAVLVKDVGVVGAGPSSLFTLKALRDRGLTATAIERAGASGGIWARDRPDSPVYENLVSNSTKRLTAVSSHAFDDEVDEFPRREDFTNYLDSYCTKFALEADIFFNTYVDSTVRDCDNHWNVTVSQSNGTQSNLHEKFRALVVATGMSSFPVTPKYPKSDPGSGRYIHASEYWSPNSFVRSRNAHVLIVGLSTSALDIAIDLARSSRVSRVTICARSSRFIVPRMLNGSPFSDSARHPVDPLTFSESVFPRLSWRRRRKVIQSFLQSLGNSYVTAEQLGFDKPSYAPWHRTLSISDDIRPYLESGAIEIVQGNVDPTTG